MAAVTDGLRRVEAALGVRYPASFHARADELAALAVTASFQRALPATTLLLDADEVRSVREQVGSGLIPFMRSAAQHPDIYAFEQGRAGEQPKVVVWCVHTTVHEWPDFDQFLSWVRALADRC